MARKSAKKITMYSQDETPINSYFQQFIISCNAKGFSDVTLKTYRSHFKSISKYLDMASPLSSLTKQDVETAIGTMRENGLAHNSISSYIRMFKSFIQWCNDKGFTDLIIPSFAQQETTKDTYSDEELKALLKKPDSNCSFPKFRNWIIILFLLNCGCRSATIRNIKNKDIDLESKRVIFRYTKNKKIQVLLLSSTLVTNLKKYMMIRKGEPDDYLFCTETGEQFTRDGLSTAIERYNKSRGVNKTSIHMFRHTFAKKYLLDCGGNALTLQKLLGHSTLEMAKHYCNIFDADIAKGYDNASPLERMVSKAEKIKK